MYGNIATMLLRSSNEAIRATAFIRGLSTGGVGFGSKVGASERGGVRSLLWRPQWRALCRGHKQRQEKKQPGKDFDILSYDLNGENRSAVMFIVRRKRRQQTRWRRWRRDHRMLQPQNDLVWQSSDI